MSFKDKLIATNANPANPVEELQTRNWEKATIGGVAYWILSSTDILAMSEDIVINKADCDNQEDLGCVDDKRMGMTYPKGKCPNDKCAAGRKSGSEHCLGHYGRIELSIPIINPLMRSAIALIFDCLCPVCGFVKKTNEDLEEYGFYTEEREAELDAEGFYYPKLRGYPRLQRLAEICVDSKCTRGNRRGDMLCSAIPPRKFLKRELKDEGGDKSDSKTDMFLYYDTIFKDEYGHKKEVRVPLSLLETMFLLLSADESAWMLGMIGSKPSSLVMEYLLVIPPKYRAPRVEGEISDVTKAYKNIVRENERLRQKMNKEGMVWKRIDKDYKNDNPEFLNPILSDYARLYGKIISGLVKGRSAEEVKRKKAIALLFTEKKGIPRNLFTNKPVPSCWRSTIGPDAHINLEEVGVPLYVLKTMTVARVVIASNLAEYTGLLESGFVKWVQDGDRKFDISPSKRHTFKLKPGMTVGRLFLPGDIVVCSRSPIIKAGGTRCHYVAKYDPEVVVGRKMPPHGEVSTTMKLNTSANDPYNADFDGDEMQAHQALTVESLVEARLVQGVDRMISNPSIPGVYAGIIDLNLLTLYKLTRPETFVDKIFITEVLESLSQYVKDDYSTLGDRLNFHKVNPYSGTALVSMMMPAGLYYNSGKLTIENGIVTKGDISSGVGKNGDVIKIITYLYDDMRAAAFINDVNRIIILWERTHQSSFSLSDCGYQIDVERTIPKENREKFEEAIKDYSAIDQKELRKLFDSILSVVSAAENWRREKEIELFQDVEKIAVELLPIFQETLSELEKAKYACRKGNYFLAKESVLKEWESLPTQDQREKARRNAIDTILTVSSLNVEKQLSANLKAIVASGAGSNSTDIANLLISIGPNHKNADMQLSNPSVPDSFRSTIYEEFDVKSEDIIDKSYLEGFDIQDAVSHLSAARIPKIASQIDVSDSGALYRNFSIATIDNRKKLDNTVRDDKGNVISTFVGPYKTSRSVRSAGVETPFDVKTIMGRAKAEFRFKTVTNDAAALNRRIRLQDELNSLRKLEFTPEIESEIVALEEQIAASSQQIQIYRELDISAYEVAVVETTEKYEKLKSIYAEMSLQDKLSYGAKVLAALYEKDEAVAKLKKVREVDPLNWDKRLEDGSYSSVVRDLVVSKVSQVPIYNDPFYKIQKAIESGKRGTPFETADEAIQIIGRRAKKLIAGEKPLVSGFLDVDQIAEAEKKRGKLSYSLTRTYPDGFKESWTSDELIPYI